jgi:hypothetical protein
MNNPGGRVAFGIVSLAWMAGSAAVMVAQGPSLAVGRGPGAGFEGAGFHGFGAAHTPVTGAPYSAVRTTTHVQTLANGSTITHTMQVKEARDSNGRTYSETLPSTMPGEGPTHSFVRVFDPVNRVSISWSAESKQATVMHMPEPGQFANARGPRAGEVAEEGRFRGNAPAATTESLGSKTINGLVADGTRTTKVIPAGAHGNSEALTITHDSWVSSDLKLEVERVDTDPRSGTTTVEVTGISREEPSASLFQAPAGFAVKEMTLGARHGEFAAAP